MAKKNLEIPKPQTREGLIDELGALEAELAAAGVPAKLSRIEKLRSKLREDAQDLDAATPVLWHGNKYSILLGEKENKRTVTDLAGLCTAMGRTKFFAACSMTLKAVEDAFGKLGASKFITEAQTGSRSIKTFPKVAQ